MFPDVCVRFFCCFLAYFIQEHDMENCDERAERIESYLEKSIGYENVVWKKQRHFGRKSIQFGDSDKARFSAFSQDYYIRAFHGEKKEQLAKEPKRTHFELIPASWKELIGRKHVIWNAQQRGDSGRI